MNKSGSDRNKASSVEYLSLTFVDSDDKHHERREEEVSSVLWKAERTNPKSRKFVTF